MLGLKCTDLVLVDCFGKVSQLVSTRCGDFGLTNDTAKHLMLGLNLSDLVIVDCIGKVSQLVCTRCGDFGLQKAISKEC